MSVAQGAPITYLELDRVEYPKHIDQMIAELNREGEVEISIEVTKQCVFMCPWCSTDATPDGKHLPFWAIDAFFEGVVKQNPPYNEIVKINVTGGECLLHPDIGHILLSCYEYTPNVWVYTNLVRNLIFNSRVVREIGEIHANVCIGPGIDAHIPENKIDMIHLLRLVHQGRAKDWKAVPIKVSGNFERSEHDCETCNHIYLQADGQIVGAPCKKVIS